MDITVNLALMGSVLGMAVLLENDLFVTRYSMAVMYLAANQVPSHLFI